jgi:pimeloyl-ACP methyl ester carboxylesterase/DNA-binding CsgD family transcriptional regulator
VAGIVRLPTKSRAPGTGDTELGIGRDALAAVASLFDAPGACVALQQTIRFCTAHDGVRLAYAKSGSGTPLVRVGNWMSHLEFDVRSPVWGHFLEALSRDHTVIRYDQRGTGLSDWDIDDISFEAWVRDLETVVDAAGVDRFALLGMSQGVPVGVAYVIRHPERVSHLILHGGYARGRRKRTQDPALWEEADTLAKLAELGWGKNDTAFRQFFTSQFIPGGTPEQHRWFNELERVSTSPHNAARMMREFDQIDVTPLLPQVACPTLVLHSNRDMRVPFAEGRLIAGLIDQARFVPLDSENHLMLEQDPAWARWLEEVQSFLGTARADREDPAFASLTPRERDLVELIAQGRDNAQIGAVLQLSDKTVRNHITSIFDKIGVESRAQAIVTARERGLGQGSRTL